MKFIPLSESEGSADKNILKEEFKAAAYVGEGRLGAKRLFYRYFINVKYISYLNIQKAYLRVESGESGEFLLQEFYLMLVFKDGGEGKLRFEREGNVKTILEYLKENYPDIEIGYKKQRPAK
ncbi:MAG: hypothetical protein NC313_17480 [Butyrivibrio sp.]|nr:hypothetical protein [Butyrivibrio sp.]MCM1264507.1 hypothetical protein [Butyrivibrio sp.]